MPPTPTDPRTGPPPGADFPGNEPSLPTPGSFVITGAFPYGLNVNTLTDGHSNHILGGSLTGTV